MTSAIYIASPEGGNGRNVVAYGVIKALAKEAATTVFRPIACRHESLTDIFAQAGNATYDPTSLRGVCPRRAREGKGDARGDIVAAYHHSLSHSDAQSVVIVGSDRSDVFDPELFTLNADVAADLKAPVFLAVCTIHRNGAQVKATVEACTRSVDQAGSRVAGVFVTGCTDEKAEDAQHALADSPVPVWTIPAVTFPDESNAQSTAEAESAFSRNVRTADLLNAFHHPFTPPVTPYAFQYSLLGKAKNDKRTIVLPEGNEDRIIAAADYLLERDIVDLLIVGERDTILARAEDLGLHSLGRASFQSMHDERMLAEMIAKLCELRSHKGMDEKKAREQLKDPSYFGTMLVVLGQADGLVSGAIHSTANTVRPALQLIKTKPGASLVSGAFLMCFSDHVAVFADCAINLNPDASQLADIALQSAETARSFGIDPKVGMLSYSTLGSGKGPDVDLVDEATALVAEKAPELPVVGPIQFDAAWSPVVAAAKARGNDTAGHVNVFVFPNLSSGNIGYKAVQRSSGALAVGPVLQGLNRPVNDLSRGALVQDIINTVALTAIEAQ